MTWDEAEAWAVLANKDREDTTKWSWDCNFKLDFDGGLVSVNSRFYPPTKTYGDKWDGTITVEVLGSVWIEKKFECDNLDQLKKEVESFDKYIKGVIKSKLIN